MSKKLFTFLVFRGTSGIFPLRACFTIRKFGKFRIVSFVQRSFTSEQNRLRRFAEQNVQWGNVRVLSDPENNSGEFSGNSGGSATKVLSGRVVEVDVEVIGAGSGESNESSEWSVEALVSFISSSWSGTGGSSKKILGSVGTGEAVSTVGGLAGSDAAGEDVSG